MTLRRYFAIVGAVMFLTGFLGYLSAVRENAVLHHILEFVDR